MTRMRVWAILNTHAIARSGFRGERRPIPVSVVTQRHEESESTARTESHSGEVDRTAQEPIRGRLRSTIALGSFDAFTVSGLFMSLAPHAPAAMHQVNTADGDRLDDYFRAIRVPYSGQETTGQDGS